MSSSPLHLVVSVCSWVDSRGRSIRSKQQTPAERNGRIITGSWETRTHEFDYQSFMALPLPSFRELMVSWIAECIYQRLPKPIHDNVPDHFELFHPLLILYEQ